MKPYVTVKDAAVLLGVPEEVIYEDIDRGTLGDLASLIGGKEGDYWFIPSWELEGDRLAWHKATLTASSGSAVEGE